MLSVSRSALRGLVRRGGAGSSSLPSSSRPVVSSAVSVVGWSESEAADEVYSRVEVRTSGSESAVLRSYQTFLLSAAGHLGVEVGRTWEPPRVTSRKTVLKSAFVHKKHRVQYENVTHFRCFELRHLTGSTLSVFLEYLERNLPEGVAMVVEKTQRQALPDHIAEARGAAADPQVPQDLAKASPPS